MNIGIIHGFVGGGGGTEKTFHAILNALETSDHNVTLYTFSKPKLKSKKIKIRSSLPISIPSFGLYQRSMESKLITKAKNEDLLIQASGGLGIPTQSNQKIIVYCHDDFSNELENPSTKYKGIWSLYYKPYYSMIKKFIAQISDPRIHLISNSKYIQNSLNEKFNKNSDIIYPPVNLSEFHSVTKERQVVTVGRFSEEKNHDFGIDVMKDLDCNYNIIGNTKTKFNILYYEKLVSKTANYKKICLFKDLDRKTLVNLVNKSKIYLHCSKETFGISVIEAISAGCIPVVPDVSAHKETVPFPELRYPENNTEKSKEIIQNALDKSFDDLLIPLKESIQKFNQNEFKNKFIEYIKNFE